MRFMVIVKATEASENGVMPSEELLAAMGRYNEELVAAGIMKAGEGLHQASLIYLGLVLFFITFVVLSLSKLLLSRLQKGEGARA